MLPYNKAKFLGTSDPVWCNLTHSIIMPETRKRFPSIRTRTGRRKRTQSDANLLSKGGFGWFKNVGREGRESKRGTLVPLSLSLGKTNVLINEIEGKYKARGV
jgi:hypothetical protein